LHVSGWVLLWYEKGIKVPESGIDESVSTVSMNRTPQTTSTNY
jgi:hypothetical protein